MPPRTFRSPSAAGLAAAALVLAGCLPGAGPDETAPAAGSGNAPALATEAGDDIADFTAGGDGGWDAVVARTGSGVVRIATVQCESGSSGSGFLIASDTVVTAGHVVRESVATTVLVEGRLLDADVLGADLGADIALLRLEAPVEGHHFTWAVPEVPVGTEVAALGYARAGEFSSQTGVVSAHTEVEGVGRLTTDLSVDAGINGGALITSAGEVAGVVSEVGAQGPAGEGTAHALSPEEAQHRIDTWLDAPQPPEAPECASDQEQLEITLTGDVTDPDVLAGTQTLTTHGNAINNSLYEVAFDMFTPELQAAMGDVDEWSSGLVTSVWTDLTLTDHQVTDDGLDLHVLLRTQQEPEYGPDGMACSQWQLTYSLRWDEQTEDFRIDQVRTDAEPVDCSA